MSVKALTFDIIGTAFDWFGSLSSGAVPLSHKYGLGLDRARSPTRPRMGTPPGWRRCPRGWRPT